MALAGVGVSAATLCRWTYRPGLQMSVGGIEGQVKRYLSAQEIVNDAFDQDALHHFEANFVISGLYRSDLVR